MSDATATGFLAWTIVTFVWQATLLGALAWLTVRLSRRVAAATRYAIALGLFACLAAMPLVTAARVGDVRVSSPGVDTSLSGDVVADRSTARNSLFVTPRSQRSTASASTFDHVASALARIRSGWVGILERLADATAAWASPIALVWILGALLFAGRVVVDIVAIWRLRRAPNRPLPPVLGARVAALIHSLGLPGRVTIAQSGKVEVPLVIGWFAPLVLVPERLVSTMSTDDAEMLVAHELAHVRRLDYAVNLCQVAVESLLFFHPVTWWMSARIRAEREHCCDERALELTGRVETEARRRYIAALLTAEEARSAPAPRLAPSSSRGSLGRRAREILDDRYRERPGAGVYAAGALFAAASAILVYSPQPAFAAFRVGLPAVSAAGSAVGEAPIGPDARIGPVTSAGSAEYEIWHGQIQRGAWLRVRNLVGSIVVEAASGQQVEVSAEGWRPSVSSPVSFVTTRQANGVTVCALRPGVDCDENGNDLHLAPSELYSDPVRLIVRIPNGTNLLVASSDGPLVVDATPGSVQAQTGRGEISVRAARGSIEAATGLGRVRIGNADGDVVVRTGGGTVSLASVAGDAEVRASSGDIDVTLGTAQRARWRFQTGSGSIRIRGMLNAARIEADATNGRVESDFPYAAVSKSSHALADPSPSAGNLLRASTANGDISIKARRVINGNSSNSIGTSNP
jgi:beta-lactamase regulating signal transducer with metallopeptidase domain